MRKTPDRNTILFVSTYPPTACGIASYTQDLLNTMNSRFSDSFDIKVCALESGKVDYPPEVLGTLNTTRKKNYIQLAHQVNSDESVQAVWIQHEFGLFEGTYGRYLLFFLREINKPVIITFHSVLPDPNNTLRKITESISDIAQVITVMTGHSKSVLTSHYNVDPSKVHVIPHGTHVVRWKNKERVKEQYGMDSNLVLTTFGLLGPNKSIETALYALPEIVREFPDVLYYVLGRTHPNEVLHHGEAYRESLMQIVEELNLKDHVRFVNEYMEVDELLQILRITDVYLFTSKDPNQAVSGTFQYAMSCGCPVVSTRIPHAVEMLEEGSGLLIEFNNSRQLAQATLRLLRDKELRENTGQCAFEQTRATSWNNVALLHAKLISSIMNHGRLQFDLPDISLDHLFRMTDHIGIMQFARVSEPDPYSGYTLDDNARALIAACMYLTYERNEQVERLIRVYLDFIKARQIKDGSFLNYVDIEGTHSQMNNDVNLDDSNGRAIWALGYLATMQDILSFDSLNEASDILYRAMRNIARMKSPRAIAFSIKGLYFFHTVKRSDSIWKMVDKFADNLVGLYTQYSTPEWKWFERSLTYGNAVLPEALLMAYLLTGKKHYRTVALESFDFLLSRIFRGQRIKVVSNHSWLHRDSPVEHEYGEQPIDVAYTIMALDLFWKVFRNPEYRKKMDIAFEWFLGRNHLNQMIYNPASGGCYDGLEEFYVNLNQGAESLACYLISRLHMEFLRQEEEYQDFGEKEDPMPGADSRELRIVNG